MYDKQHLIESKPSIEDFKIKLANRIVTNYHEYLSYFNENEKTYGAFIVKDLQSIELAFYEGLKDIESPKSIEERIDDMLEEKEVDEKLSDRMYTEYHEIFDFIFEKCILKKGIEMKLYGKQRSSEAENREAVGQWSR